MVTTTAPSPFLARISAGTEDPRRFPTSLFQRLIGAEYNGESHQPGCCPVGPGGTTRPALKKVRRRRGKIRSTPSGLLQSRYQQYQQHRAGLGRRNTAQGTRNLYEVPAASSEPGQETVPKEKAPAASPRTAPVSFAKPLRKELLKTRIAKSEKVTIPYSQPVHSIHLCDQSKTNRQRSKCNIPLNKIPPIKKSENNFWHEPESPELIKKQEKKALKNTEHVKAKKTIFLTEANQKENYAGAKFSDPPSPSVLPKPPSHWVGSTVEYSDQNKEMMAFHLKTLLKVQA
ncbi:Proline-rich nuclear receptor coactivator 1 [Varanus komodoensis]|uniref:Proline rich nuclear receptor coactivator 1 n=1 Tax=Varanus komodoensis TaxID=61221 RepID=A0A8D2PYV6_VARKO|nr:proline-rich nuclear receptor coactivator 1 [Varanus komodoensis]KAF7253821.1 Proline-rich nuclear receptor coactivator 1 [Varanus komodoensis]